MGVLDLVVGVDIGGTKVLAGAVDASGTVLHAYEAPTGAGSASVLSAIEEVVRSVGEVAAVGVGAAAYVTHPAGRIVFSPNVEYENPNLRRMLQERTGLPVLVDNDANAATWGEAVYGAGKGVRDFIMLTLGTGIGGGAVIGGRLYRGGSGLAGEFGHMTVDAEGAQCACGRRGCLEALASGTAIARIASDLWGLSGTDREELTGKVVSRRAEEGDEIARRALQTAGMYLGLGLASLVNAFDPSVVVLGGGAAGAADDYLGTAGDVLARELEGRRPVPQIERARLGNRAGMIGAAELARMSVNREVA